MVGITEIAEELTASEERQRDAEEIEALAAQAQRASVQVHLQALAKKLRKESEALQRLEQSKAQTTTTSETSTAAPSTEPTAVKENKPPTVATTTPTPVATATPPAIPSPLLKYTAIDRFSFDAGQYNSQFVTVYVPLPGVGTVRDAVTCHFGKDSFDLIVPDLRGQSYRLYKDQLEKDIDTEKCKFIVKADKIIVKLAKIKGEYGSYDYWTKLSDPKKKNKKDTNPQASIMQLMKDMYEDGDDQMKKVIGETMLKQQRGELGKDGGLGDDMKFGADDDF